MEQIDFAIQGKASQLGKELGGFETTEYQLNILYGKPISEQAESLVRTLAKLESAKASGIALAEAYKRQDLNGVFNCIIKEQNDSDEPEWKKQRSIDELIYNRNAAWAKKLQELMPKKSLLVVVGAGHLPGERGLIDLLQKAGYTVEPMK